MFDNRFMFLFLMFWIGIIPLWTLSFIEIIEKTNWKRLAVIFHWERE